jgi:hypothetical protein
MADNGKTIRPLYDCTVLLGGSRDNSVFVPGISAVEMYVLQAIHGANETGNDPITNVKKTGKGVDRSDAQERARIAARYNSAGPAGGIAILNRLYGVGNKLPLEYEAPVYGDAEDAPLQGAPESIIDLDPAGEEITSVPPPKAKKTAKAESVLDDN